MCERRPSFRTLGTIPISGKCSRSEKAILGALAVGYSRSSSRNSETDSRNTKLHSRNGISRLEQDEHHNSRSNSRSDSGIDGNPHERLSKGRNFFAYSCVWELSCLQFELFCLQLKLSWRFFACSGKVHLISTLTICKQRSLPIFFCPCVLSVFSRIGVVPTHWPLWDRQEDKGGSSSGEHIFVVKTHMSPINMSQIDPECAAKGGRQKGIGHFFPFRSPFCHHFLTFWVTL